MPGGKTVNQKKPFVVALLRYLKYLLLVSLAAEFPLLVYWAANLGQVRPAVAYKPLVWIFLGAWAVYSLFSLVLRRLDKSTLLTLLFTLLFFTYGHVVNLVEPLFPNAGTSVSFIILVVYGLLFLVGLFQIFHNKRVPPSLYPSLLAIFSLLVLFNAGRILLFDPRFSQDQTAPSLVIDPSLHPGEGKPDVYLIILDSYAREDVLAQEFNFDNSAFLDELRARGFYIPECALSNYDKTPSSVPSFLNMEYLNQMGIPNSALDGLSAHQIDLILNNQARNIFSQMEYQFVSARGYGAFDDIQDADMYLNYYYSQGLPDELADRNFLYLFSQTTLLEAFFEAGSTDPSPAISGQLPTTSTIDTSGMGYEEALFWYHQTNYVFDSLKALPDDEEDYFVYTHINAPHIPYVFASDGSFRFITDYTDAKLYYIDAVTYVNARVLDTVDAIIANSDTPPVIIIQADHSAQFFESGIQNHKILSAYYLPGEIDLLPYETITPVNSLRLVLHNYFDPSIKLLPDLIYVKGSDGQYKEVQAACGL
jgi:hypothetical protein